VRESDAAALLLRLLFRKYALDGGWTVTLTPEVVATPPAAQSESESVADRVSQRLASARTAKSEEKARRARTARLLGASRIRVFFFFSLFFLFPHAARRDLWSFSSRSRAFRHVTRRKHRQHRHHAPSLDARKHIL
jgi:hypothetical protein